MGPGETRRNGKVQGDWLCLSAWRLCFVCCSSVRFRSHFYIIWLHWEEYVIFYEGRCVTCITMNRRWQLLHLEPDNESMWLLKGLKIICVAVDQGDIMSVCESHGWQEVEIQQTNWEFGPLHGFHTWRSVYLSSDCENSYLMSSLAHGELSRVWNPWWYHRDFWIRQRLQACVTNWRCRDTVCRRLSVRGHLMKDAVKLHWRKWRTLTHTSNLIEMQY